MNEDTCHTICILLDNNALQFLSDNNNINQRQKDLINEHYQNKKLFLHISPSTFQEQIKGVNESCFPQMQRFFKTAYSLTHGCHVTHPELHLKKITGAVTDNELWECVRIDINTLRELVCAPNFEDWSGKFRPLQNYVKGVLKWIHSGAEELKSKMDVWYREAEGGSYTEKTNMISKNEDTLRNVVYKALLKRYKLEDSYNLLEARGEAGKLISLDYLANVYLYYYGTILRSRKPRSGDHIDLEQVVYLNIIDYIMTRDKRYIELLNECGDPELKGRTITPEVFLKNVKYAPWPKRARDNFDQKYVPLK